MTRALLLLVGCSLAMAQTPAPTHEVSPADWRFAHPDADMKISINLHAVLNSDAVSKAIEQVKAQAKDNAAQVNLVLGMLRTVDRVSVSARQKARGDKAPQDMDVLAEVTGSFDPQFIAGMFPSAGNSQVKVVGPHTLLIGEGDSFTGALARVSAASPPVSGATSSGPGIIAGVSRAELEPSDIWIEASVPYLAQQSGQQGAPMLKDLQRLAMGLTLGTSPVVDIALTATNDAAAAGLLTMLQAMTPFLAAQPSTAAVAKNLNFTQHGSELRMHLVIPPEVLAMAQQQAASALNDGGLAGQLAPLLGAFGIGPSSNAAPARLTPPPPARNDGSIKIYGLDDGPKEIPAPK